MTTNADNYGNTIDKYGIAPTFRWGIGTADEFSLGCYYLNNNNGINYGLPWLRQTSSADVGANPSGLVEGRPEELLRRGERLQRRRRRLRHRSATRTASPTAASCTRSLRHGRYDRDQRAGDDPLLRAHGQRATARHQPRLPGRRADAVDDQRRDAAHARHQQQGAEPDTPPTCRATTATSSTGSACANEVLAGVDLAHEEFNNYTLSLPPGVVARTRTLRAPPRHAGRRHRRSTKRCASSALDRNFVAKALGVYAQDLVQVAPPGRSWPACAGTSSRATTDLATATSRPAVIGTEIAPLALRLALEQPRRRAVPADDTLSFHASYGTSFNTSGELYNYDPRARTRRRRRAATSSSAPSSTCSTATLSSTRVAVFRLDQVQRAQPRSPDGCRSTTTCSRASATPPASSSTSPAASRRAGRSTARTPGSRSRRSTRRPGRRRSTGELRGPAPVDDAAPQRHDLVTTYQVTRSCASAAA